MVFIALFLSVAGTLDDIHPFDFKPEFQFRMASGVVLLLGHHFGTISVMGHRLELESFGPIFRIVAVINAFNIIDGIDGLAGGVAICGFSTVAFLAYANGATYLLTMGSAPDRGSSVFRYQRAPNTGWNSLLRFRHALTPWIHGIHAP